MSDQVIRYDAITIDTQTVLSKGFHFERGLLAQLRQFKGGAIKVIISEVILKEVSRRLLEKTQAVKDASDLAERAAVEFGLLQASSHAMGDGDRSPILVAQTRIEGFLSSVDAEIISADLVSMSALLQRYFIPAPPFSATGKKKNEFPDAIALLSLEVWANQNNKRVLAVSGDSDWAAFASRSEVVDVVAELGDALTLLQEHAEQANLLVNRLLMDIQSKVIPDLSDYFENKLSILISDYIVDGQADSAYQAELDQIDLTMMSYNFRPSAEGFEFDIVQNSSDFIVARVEIEARVRADATFSLSIYDSIDKDSVPMGSVGTEKEVDFEFSTLVYFEGQPSLGEVGIGDVEIVDAPHYIDFGWIEPDYGEEFYDDSD